ncbi:MAG: GNAT family N-acetyltransferase [Ruminococcus sp.]|nr:GNAT family N-acetyltransferase [Ruminococcus sp.]
MINYIESGSSFENIISAHGNHDVFLTKIIVLYRAYGISKYADFWYQHIFGRVTAIICRVGNDFLLSCTNFTDFEELKEFLNVLGFTSVLCDEKIPINPVCSRCKTGFVMQLKNKTVCNIQNVTTDRNYKELYSFLKKINSSSIPLPGYADFVTDLFAKVRNNIAEIHTIKSNEKIIAACISVTDGINTVISPLATSEEYRGKGLAKALVYSLQGNVCLLCNDGINRIIYEKMGFAVIGNWKEIYR